MLLDDTACRLKKLTWVFMCLQSLGSVHAAKWTGWLLWAWDAVQKTRATDWDSRRSDGRTRTSLLLIKDRVVDRRSA